MPMLLVDFTEQQQSGIGGDVATGEIGFNLAAGEWREGQFFRYDFGSGCWCFMDWLGYWNHRTFSRFLFMPCEKSGAEL